MCLIWLLFIVAVVLPIVGKLVEEPDSGLGQTVLIIVAAVAALVALALIWRRLAARPGTEGAQLRVPDPATVARLDWPRNLSRVELEAFCTAFLRGQGWKVAPMLSEVAGSTYLDARGGSARALLLCEPDGATLDPVSVRTVTLAASGVPGAVPVVVLRSREKIPPPVHKAAEVAGVQLLQVSDLPHLAALLAPKLAEGATPPHP